jgi:hypothetical protein
MLTDKLTQEELIEALKKDGSKIGEQSHEGNEKASKVIECYSMWYKCPGDSCAFVLCERAYAEWKGENGK